MFSHNIENGAVDESEHRIFLFSQELIVFFHF
jgi:hypothetical protein